VVRIEATPDDRGAAFDLGAGQIDRPAAYVNAAPGDDPTIAAAGWAAAQGLPKRQRFEPRTRTVGRQLRANRVAAIVQFIRIDAREADAHAVDAAQCIAVVNRSHAAGEGRAGNDQSEQCEDHRRRIVSTDRSGAFDEGAGLVVLGGLGPPALSILALGDIGGFGHGSGRRRTFREMTLGITALIAGEAWRGDQTGDSERDQQLFHGTPPITGCAMMRRSRADASHFEHSKSHAPTPHRRRRATVIRAGS